MGVTIITAGRGEGKTTFLIAYTAWQAALGRSIGGIAAPAAFEDGIRVGYDLLDLRTGQRRLLARIAAPQGTPPTIGMYRFDDEAVTQGNSAITSAIKDRFDVVGIDEVGQLEFQGGGWSEALRFSLLEYRRLQELVVVVRRQFAHQLFECFPHDGWQSARRVSPPWPTFTLKSVYKDPSPFQGEGQG